MNVREVAPGLWYWAAPHPDWGGATDWPEEVGCVCYRGPRALVVGEFFIGTANGLRLSPSPTVRDLDAFHRSMRKLLELPIERVLVAHGPPVWSNGHESLAAALTL